MDDELLSERIVAIHAESHQIYGHPRMRVELAEQVVHVGGNHHRQRARQAATV
jgi:hypothetical protein